MQIVLQFRVFLIAAIIVALAMEIALLFGTKHFGWQRKNLWIYRFFFGLTRPQCCFLAASWLWLLFTATSALFVVDMQLCHLAMLLLLSAAKFTAWKRMQMLLRDLFNSVLLFAAMMAENLLHSYLLETRFQFPIFIILGLLIVFIILYALYFTLRDMYLLAKDRAMNRPVAEEKTPREEDAPGEDETPENGTDEPNQTADEKTDGDSRSKRKRTSRKRQNQKNGCFIKKEQKQEVTGSERKKKSKVENQLWRQNSASEAAVSDSYCDYYPGIYYVPGGRRVSGGGEIVYLYGRGSDGISGRNQIPADR